MKPKASPEDVELFRRTVGTVKPLDHDRIVTPPRRRNDAVMVQRLDRSDGPAEQLDVFGAGLRFHATSGRGLSVYFPRLLKAPPNATP